MKTMTLAEFHAALQAQGVKTREDFAMVCPMCKTVQSARDLIAAGAGSDIEAVEHYLGFSCFGRFTGAGSPRSEADGKPCDWTLGGFLHAHTLEVVMPDGMHFPTFEPATPGQAQQHEKELNP